MAKILVVEDEPAIARSVSDSLVWEHHTVEVVANGRDALDLLKTYQFDVIVLDWNLPGMSGLEICKELRNERNNTPVLMLTGKTDLVDKESGLDAGADDYLTKPFQTRELTARVRSLLRRSSGLTSNVLEVADLVLDVKSARVMRQGKVVKLTRQEMSVLEFLMRNKDQLFSSDALLDRVWESDSEASTESVRQCIRRLRQKLDIEGSPSVICTLPGLGYKVESSPSGSHQDND